MDKTENSVAPRNEVAGFRFYREGCGYTNCTFSSNHYHCLSCGFSTNEVPLAVAHKNSCSVCNVENFRISYSRPSCSHLSSESREACQISQTLQQNPVFENNSDVPMQVSSNSVQSSNLQGYGSYYCRGSSQQSPVFNPLISSQGQSLYNGVFSSQVGFSNQNTFTAGSYNSYNIVDPSTWLTDVRVSSSNTSPLIDSGRVSKNYYTDKNSMNNSHNITHSCCSNRFSVVENINLCSPLSAEALKSLAKDSQSCQMKMNGNIETQNWYCTLGNQQNQTIDHSAYKCNDQFPSCALSHLNPPLQDHSDLKQPLPSHMNNSCFEATDHGPITKQLSQPVDNQTKLSCVDPRKDQSLKYCSISKELSNDHIMESGNQKQADDPPSNASHMMMFNGPFDDLVYTQNPYMLHMSNDNIQSRPSPSLLIPKHQMYQQSHFLDVNKPFPALQENQYHSNSRRIDVSVSCNLIDTNNQAESKSNCLSSGSITSCCQLSSVDPSVNPEAQTTFHSEQFVNNHSVRCLSSCPPLELVNPSDEDKENSNQGSPSSSAACESDIIVEETEEEEVGDEEITESEISVDESKTESQKEELEGCCVVCSGSLGAYNSSYCSSTANNTLRASMSNIPIVKKLNEILNCDFVLDLTFHICRRCFNLVDMIDRLEVKLDTARKDIIELYKAQNRTKSKTKSVKVLEISSRENVSILTKAVLQEEIPNKDHRLPGTIDNNPESGLENENKYLVNNCEKVCDEHLLKNEHINTSDDVENSPSDVSSVCNDVIVESGNEENLTENKHYCQICSKQFASKEYLKKHQQQHTQSFSFYCDRCGRGFMLRRGLENHLLTHTGEFRYQCEECGKTFIQKYCLEDHLQKHKGKYRFHCSHCGKGFMYSSSLKVHERIHSGEKPFVCQHCGRRFTSNSNFKAHVHLCSGELPFHCEKCNKKFVLKAQLEAHIKAKHEDNYKMRCDVCGKGFVKEFDYKVHCRTHTGEKPHKCNICGKTFSVVGNLNQHKKQHDSERPFKCDICGKGFLRKTMLTAHINEHSGLRPYSCERCDKNFTSQRNLHAHLLWHDKKIKQHTCPVCGKTINHSLSVHMRIHSGEKPYECSDCKMSFSVKSTLNKHIKVKHKI